MSKLERCYSDQFPYLFKYVLRLLAIAEAENLETHLKDCPKCGKSLTEINHFFQLLSLSLRDKSQSKTKESSQGANAEKVPPLAIEDILNKRPDIDREKIVETLSNSYLGFRRLAKSIATRMGPQAEPLQVERAAIEILLALPNHVTKISKP